MKITQASLLLTALIALTEASPVDSAAAPNCVDGAHIIVARGSRLPQSTEGTLAEVVQMIKAQVPNSDDVSTVYPAAVGLDYFNSINAGVSNTRSQIATYVAKCGADSKIVLLGFSQGGTVMTNTLAGNRTGETGLASEYFKNIAAVAVFGDPSFVIGQPYDAGNATHSGNFARNNPQALVPYKAKLRSYCSSGDEFCDRAGPKGKSIHNHEVQTWAQDATDFIVPLLT